MAQAYQARHILHGLYPWDSRSDRDWWEIFLLCSAIFLTLLQSGWWIIPELELMTKYWLLSLLPPDESCFSPEDPLLAGAFPEELSVEPPAASQDSCRFPVFVNSSAQALLVRLMFPVE